MEEAADGRGHPERHREEATVSDLQTERKWLAGEEAVPIDRGAAREA
jgi:hypothetical protein